MPEYFTLFNAVTDAIAQLEKAVAALKQAQLDAEEAYIRPCCGPSLCAPVRLCAAGSGPLVSLCWSICASVQSYCRVRVLTA